MKIAGEIQFFTEFFVEHDRDVDGSSKTILEDENNHSGSCVKIRV